MKKYILILFIVFVSFSFYQRIYAKEDLYQYRIEYYYDGILDRDATIYKEGAFASFVMDYETRNREGYVFSHSSIDDAGMTVTSDEDANVIQVFYEKRETEKKVDASEDTYTNTDTMLMLKRSIQSIFSFLRKLVTS